MIIEYHRPRTIEEALALLARTTVMSKPIGGGTALNHTGREPVAVVDLQSLGLVDCETKGTTLNLGACLTLQSMLGLSEIPPALLEAIPLEANYNIRQVATLAGSLIASDGRSPLATAMLAMDASVQILHHRQKPVQLSLGDFLPMRREKLIGALLTQVGLPVNARLAYQFVARTPADRPIVCVAVSIWPSGRTRIALGGWGASPTLVMDGPEAEGGEIAAENACTQATDAWASATYRQHAAGVITRRCLEELLVP